MHRRESFAPSEREARAEGGPPIVVTSEMLETALRNELRHLAELCRIIEGRRRSARDETGARNDSVYEIHRVLVALTEAKRHREGVLRYIVGDRTIRLAELERHLGAEPDGALLTVRNDLVSTAVRVSRGLRANRPALGSSLAAADAEIRALVEGTEVTPGYLPVARPSAPMRPEGSEGR